MQPKRLLNENLDLYSQANKEPDSFIIAKAINSFKTFEKEGKVLIE